MLDATTLTKRYQDVTALNALTLSVAPGEVFCLLDANGAGKTTTINLLLNFIQQTSGSVSINGIDVVKQPLETKKHVAYIPETVMLYRNLTVRAGHRRGVARAIVGHQRDALAAAWLVFVVLLPSAFNLLATSLYPVPSRVEMMQSVRAASDEANRQGSQLLAKYYEDHPELASGGAEQAMNDFTVIRVAVGAEVEQRVRPVLDRYERQLASQQRIIDRLRLPGSATLAERTTTAA